MALLVALTGCGEECPGIPLEMREFSGEDVVGTSIWCDGEFYDVRWTGLCGGGGTSYAGDTPDPCTGTTINVSRSFFIGFYPRLIFHDAADGLTAHGYVDYDTDLASANGEELPLMLLGAVAPQEHGADGRYRGRFEMLVELDGQRGTIRGTYDTAP